MMGLIEGSSLAGVKKLRRTLSAGFASDDSSFAGEQLKARERTVVAISVRFTNAPTGFLLPISHSSWPLDRVCESRFLVVVSLFAAHRGAWMVDLGLCAMLLSARRVL